MRIKLVAIDKEEAAYMSEWIYHHLSFGFDSIDVYTNNISDNTKGVLKKISKKYDVTDVDADFILGCSNGGFQTIAYGIALQKAKLDGYSHIMFLDIDEFWTPKDFQTSIKDFLINLKDPDIVSFPWFLKVDKVQFSSPFQNSNRFVPNRHVKTIIKTGVSVSSIDIHCIVSSGSISILPDGNILAEHGKNVPLMDKAYDIFPPAFISHRLCRSEVEFVSLLGRGRPGSAIGMAALKKNRPTFIRPSEHDLVFEINANIMSNYTNGLNEFLEHCSVNVEINKGQDYVLSRYFDVIDRFKVLGLDESKEIIKLLKGVGLPEVQSVLNTLEQKNIIRSSFVATTPEFKSFKNPSYVNDKLIEFLRDEAFRVEKSDPELSLSLMSLALQFRPHGPVIRAKVLELQEKLM
jgi:hypothetical protein